jgi:DNA-directed RNA polymerase subunit L
MSKYFTDIEVMKRDARLGPPDTFRFRSKKLALGAVVANSVRRAMARDVLTYTVAPETIKYEHNTSPWDPEMITHQIIYMAMYPEYLDKSDLNMMELVLDIQNEEKYYRWVFAGEFVLRNKETNEKVPIEKVLVYPQVPLFNLGPGQKVHLTCSVEKLTKADAENKGVAGARHQAATVGIDFLVDEKDPDSDPDLIHFLVNIQTGVSPKELVVQGMESLIDQLTFLQEAIKTRKSDKFYLQINRYFRYDFVFLGEDHTLGNLIEKWINRHDPKSAAGYRQTRDRRSITIDYGLFKFVPPILQDKISSNDLEEVVERSITSLDSKKEEEQRLETIRTFLEQLGRIEAYIKELLADWKKVSVKDVSVQNFMKETERLRETRQTD